MLKFILQFLFIFFLLVSNKKVKGSWITPSGVLLGIYTVCSFMAIIDLMINDYWTQPYSDAYWLPMLEFDLFILLFLFPFRRYDEVRVSSLRLPGRGFLDLFSSIIIVLSLYAIVYYGVTVAQLFLGGGELKTLRYDMTVSGEFYVESGILNTIASVSAANYVFAIVLYFIYQIIGGSKFRKTLLLISSVSNVVHVLAFIGRDGVVFWIFSFAFCYALFKPYMDQKTLKKMSVSIIRLGLVISVPFLLITISRFALSDGGTGGSVISYLGQSFIFGPLFFGIEYKPMVSFESSFPLIDSMLGLQNPTYISSGFLEYGDWKSGIFSTFVVSLYRSLNLGGLMVFILLYYLLFTGIIRKSIHQIDLGTVVFYLFCFQIISQGVFYFCHATRGGNLFILTTLFLGFLFMGVSKNTNRPIIISKK